MQHRLARRVLGTPRRMDREAASRRLAAAERILLVKPHHKLGDLLVATPLIRNLRRALPRAEIVLLAGRANAGAVLDSPDLDRVIVADLKGPLAPFRAVPLLVRLRRARFDVALLLSTLSQSSTAVFLARRAGAGALFGFDDRRYGGDLAELACDYVVPMPEDDRLHIVDLNLALIEGLGVAVTSREHVLGVTPEQRAAGRQALAGLPVDPARPVLGIQPGGTPRRAQRRWPAASYAAIAQRVRAELGWNVVLIGAAEDRPVLEEVQGLSRSPFPTLTGLPFPLYKGLLAELSFFLTHDGGPAHIAAAAGVPTFVVYLVTPAWRWAPYGAHVHVIEDLERPAAVTDVWAALRPRLEAAAAEPSR